MSGSVRFIGYVEKVEGEISTIRLLPEFSAGLNGVVAGSQLIVLYWFHLRDNPEHRSVLSVVPRRHGETEPRGVFATRSPSRPNPIGVTEATILDINHDLLQVQGLDALEGSPIIDLKPVSH